MILTETADPDCPGIKAIKQVCVLSGRSLHCSTSVQVLCRLMLRVRSTKQQSMLASHCSRLHIVHHCGTVVKMFYSFMQYFIALPCQWCDFIVAKYHFIDS